MATPPPRNRWPVLALQRGCLLALALSVIALFVSWPWTGFAATYGAWIGWPLPTLLAPLAIYVAAATLVAGRWRWLGKLLASAGLLWLWASHRVLTMGDGAWWRKATADGTVTWAEPLSSHLQILLHRAFGASALEWFAPVTGALATWVWLTATDGLGPGGSPRARRLASALLWSSGGLVCAFFHRYVEHTQIGVPLLLLALAGLSRWTRELPANPTLGMRALFLGTSWLLLAAALHAMYVGMLGATAFAALLVAHQHGRRAGRAALGLALAAAATLAAIVALFRFGPYTPFVGSIGGGADAQLLTPALFAPDHLALVTFLLAFGVPLALPFALVALVRPRQTWASTDPIAVAAAFAWFVFAAGFGFDLGWPNDADLMLAMSVALSWLLATWLVPRANTVALVLLLLANLSTWSLVAPLVRPQGLNASQANSARARLQIDGMPAPSGPGPFELPVAIGTTLELRASGPAGAEFWILRGKPSPACEGDPYGGVADIVPSLEPWAFVHIGRFAADGTATARWVVQALPDGSWPGLQMLVLNGTGNGRSQTSAAFYLRAP